MTLRVSNPKKWNENWFGSLSPGNKFIYCYLEDNCDIAGFYEINLKMISMCTGVAPDKITASIKAMGSAIATNADGSCVWLKRFLFYQGKLPLSPEIESNKQIVFILRQNLKGFTDADLTQIIYDYDVLVAKMAPAAKVKKVAQKKGFERPTEQQVEQYMVDLKWPEEFCKLEAKKFILHYNNNGWKVGQWPMKNWETAVEKWANNNSIFAVTIQEFEDYFVANDSTKQEATDVYNHYKSIGWMSSGHIIKDWKAFALKIIGSRKRNGIGDNNKQTRMDNIKEANQKLEGFDYDQLGKE
jgi:hypothetical protein